MSKIKIIDSTLREGSQAPNVVWNFLEVKNISRTLARYGVDCVEVGHPYACDYEMSKVKTVVDLNLGLPILAHARAVESDIQAVKESGADWVGIFIGINEISLSCKFSNKTVEDVLNDIDTSVKYAKELGLNVRFTLEDSSRTDADLQILAFKRAIQSGVDRICYSDTVGKLNTKELQEEVQNLRANFPDTSIEVHLHNDRGLALASALAIADTVDWVSCSVNGIGERCGITDTIAFKSNLMVEAEIELTKEEIDLAKNLSTMVNSYSRSTISERSPLVGKNAFTHCADLHVKAFEKNIDAYCWIQNYSNQKGHRNEEVPNEAYVNNSPQVISATELKYHRKGPGNRYLMMDERVAPNVKQYCIVREINVFCYDYPSYVDTHVHHCDSLFLFLGDDPGKTGLKVMVQLGEDEFELDSPASVFIPSGKKHTYKVLKGKGTFVNHVLHGNYNDSLLEVDDVEEEEVKGQEVLSETL